MSRNRIAANTCVFSRLDEFCASAEVRLETHGHPRWIATKSPDRHVLDKLKLSDTIRLGRSRYLSFGCLDQTRFVIASGIFDAAPPPSFEEIEVGPGHLTAILADIPVPISASAYEVKDVVDLHDQATKGYDGHDHTQIAKLFPSIRLFSSKSDLVGPWNSFFQICVEERSQGLDALDTKLRQDLIALAELDPHRLPYPVLCRSIFDSDPSSLFLALYRCLESLYSYSSSLELGRCFKLEQSWQEIAATVERITGWYPREEASLERLLRFASQADLESLIVAAGKEVVEGQSVSIKAAKAIYSIRNSAVHYRPSHQADYQDSLDWTTIYRNMVGVVLDVYVEASNTI